MTDPIVTSASAVTLVGGGAVYPGDLEAALALAPMAVAADGGADVLLAAGHSPEAVIGDLDSLSRTARATIPPQRLVPVREQDSTDFEKALSRIAAPLVIGVGFTGARVDHTLAGFHTLLRFAHKPTVLLAEREVILLAPPRLTLELPADAPVSVYPLAPTSGRSTGLFWPIDGLAFAAGERIGTSNRAVGGMVCLEADAPGLLLLLPKDALGAVMQALLFGAPEPARWPARA